MKEPTVNRARISILSEMLSFPTVHGKDWTTDTFSSARPVAGDLVSMSSAPDSKWYLSWVVEIKNMSGGSQYLLKSIEDGSLCWWSNVWINIYNRERVADRHSWKWNDAQFAFNDRWMKVARENDAYIVLPVYAVFNGDEVTLNVRVRFGWSDYHNPRTFPNWRKVTMKQMDEYYKECVAGEAVYKQSKAKKEAP